MPQRIHRRLGVAGQLIELAAQTGEQCWPVGRLRQRARVEQLVEDDWMLVEVLRQPSRSRDQLGDALQRRRMLLQQREVGHSTANRLDQVEQGRQRRVSPLHGLSCPRQQWHQRIDPRLSIGRQGAIAATLARGEQPFGECRVEAAAGQRFGTGSGIGTAMPELRQGGVVGFGWRVTILEYGFEYRRHATAPQRDVLGQAVPVGVTHQASDAGTALGLWWQLLRLSVVDVLQRVFKAAQKIIGGQQHGRGVARQATAIGQALQGATGRPLTQIGVSPAANQLEDLRDELDLANAAGAQLDVVLQVAPRHLGADLPVQIAQSIEC